MLKDRGEPVAPWRCVLKYAPRAWNCGGPNSLNLSTSHLSLKWE